MVRAGDLSIVFVSYDEPEAEAHWADLKAKFPHAERVRGVAGFLGAHRAAAAAATTDRFVTVDAGNVVDPAFAEHGIDRDKLDSPRVIVWPARNAVNGLCYGDGGLRCWPRSLARDGLAADSGSAIPPPLVFEARSFSTLHPNGSPLHAFRAAFHEGARLSLADGGGGAGGLPLAERLSPVALRRLLVWCTVGADAENGLWCLYGARLGCAMAQQRGRLDIRSLGRPDGLDRLWREEVAPRFAGGDVVCPRTGYGWDGGKLQAAVRALGDELCDGSGLGIVELDPARSRFFRQTYAQGVDTSPFDMLGNLYRDGRHFPKDPAKAALSYRIGAMLGNGNAMNILARLYREGEGVPRDLDQAVQLLLQATAVGNRFAPYHLGRMYRDGRGVTRDARRAAALFETAAARGFIEAHRDLGRLHAAGLDGGAPDPERAYAHFLLAGAAAEADREALAGSLSPDAIARARSLIPSLRTRAASP